MKITKVMLEEKNTALETAIEQLNARLEKAAACWREQRAINVALDGDNSRLTGEIKRRDAAIADLKKTKAAAEANAANALKEVKRLNASVEDLQNANDILNERLQKAATCWKQQREEIANLKNELEAAKAHIAELEAQLSNGTTTAA